MSKEIFLKNYELYSGIPGFTGVIQRLEIKELAARYPNMTIDINNVIRDDMDEIKRGLRNLNQKGKIDTLPKIQQAVEKTIRNASLFVNRISEYSANRLVLSAMFDGDLPQLGQEKEGTKMWYDSYQRIRQQIVDKIAALYLSFNIRVFSAPEEADHQIIKDYKQQADHKIDIVCSNDKIYIHNKIPTLIQLKEEGSQLICYIIDIKKWNPQKIKKKGLFDFINMLDDPYKVALFEAVRCDSKYNQILRYYQPGEVVDQEYVIPLPVRSLYVQQSSSLDQFFEAIKAQYPTVQITDSYRNRSKKIVILHLFAWCYSRKNKTLQFLNPELLEDGVFSLDQIFSVLDKKKQYDQKDFLNRLKQKGMFLYSPTSQKQRRDRLSYCSYRLTVQLQKTECQANDLFYRIINHLKFQEPIQRARSRYPRVAIDLLEVVSQTLQKIEQQFKRLTSLNLTILNQIEAQINQDCIKQIILNVYLLIENKFQVVAFIDAKKYATKSSNIAAQDSNVYLDSFWKKFVKMVFLAIQAMKIEVRIVEEFDVDYEILNSFNNHDINAVYSKKQFFVIHKVPILYNFHSSMNQKYLEIVDLAAFSCKSQEKQQVNKFVEIAENFKKRAFYQALRKSTTLDRLSQQFKRFTYPKMIEKLSWSCSSLEEIIKIIEIQHFSHIHLSKESLHQMQAQMRQIYELDLSFSLNPQTYPLPKTKKTSWLNCFCKSTQKSHIQNESKRKGTEFRSEEQRFRVFAQLMKKKYLFLSCMRIDKTISLSVAEQQIQKFCFK